MLTPSEDGGGNEDEVQGLDQEAFIQFLQQQQQDLALRREEQELRRAEIELRRDEVQVEKARQDRSFDYATRALEIDKERGERKDAADRDSSRAGAWIISGFLLACAVVVILAMYWNKESFIAEIFRYAVTFLGGGGVGFTVARGAAKGDESEKKDPPIP